MKQLRFDELNILEQDYFEPMQISGDSKTKRRTLANLLTDAFLLFFSVLEVHEQHNKVQSKKYYQQYLANNISEAVTKITGIDSYMSMHIAEVSKEVVDTTFKHVNTHTNPDADVSQGFSDFIFINKTSADEPSETLQSDGSLSGEDEEEERKRLEEEEDDEEDDENFWLSLRRAEDIAKSEANTFLNYTDYVDAKSEGYTKKTWLTMLDDKVRNTHEEVEGQTIGIDETFQVGDSIMRFPHDLEYSPDPKEIINCRCAVQYSKE